MKRFKQILYISLLFTLSCKTTSETSTTKPLNETENLSEGIVYALPKTNLRFRVEAVRTDIFPGPYHQFAEKYLGIKNVPDQKLSKWEITNITIESYNDMDSEQIYVLEPVGKFSVDMPKLIENKLVFPVNGNNKDIYRNQFYGKSKAGNEIVFKDLSVAKYIGEEQVTYYKRVQRDSLFAKVPVVKTQSVYKTFEDKAEEASSFIFMIREKRFELLSGMADYYPDGKALDVALKEFNRLENEYIDLFVGKEFKSSYTAEFEFTPKEKDLHQPYILFRFSEEKGILPATDLRGRPILVEQESLHQIKNIESLFKEKEASENTYEDKLYYRIPSLTQVKVLDEGSVLANRKVEIQQFGQIILIPSMFLMGDEKFIEFFKEGE